MDKKRLIYAAIFLVVSIGLGYLMYRFFWASKAPVAKKTTTTQVAPGKTLPSAGEAGEKVTIPTTGKLPTAKTIPTTPTAVKPLQTTIPYPIKKVADAPILGTDVDRSGTTKFYNQTDGKFYRVGKDGNVQGLSNEVFYDVQNVTWSPTQNESVIEYPDGANIYYNFDTKKQITLPKHWQDFSFSSLGDKIAAKSIGLSPENRWLISADPQGKNITAIEPLGNNADKVTVNWSPNKQIVATSLTGEALGADRQEVLFIGQHHENFKSIIVEGRGFESQWSPQGGKLLYSVYSARSNFNPELWIVNTEGEKIGTGRKMLNLNTWSTKCAFADEKFAYCAVPSNLGTGTGFAPGLADNIQDKIYKIDIESGLKSELKLDEFHVISSIYVGDGGKTLYFTDKNQIGLFSLPL